MTLLLGEYDEVLAVKKRCSFWPTRYSLQFTALFESTVLHLLRCHCRRHSSFNDQSPGDLRLRCTCVLDRLTVHYKRKTENIAVKLVSSLHC